MMLSSHTRVALPSRSSSPAAPHALADLDALEAWLRARPAELGDLARFDPAGYCRQVIACNETTELVIVGWLPGQGTPVHGHGESVGLVRVLTGTLEEVCFQPGPDGALGVTRRIARVGDVLRETRGRVHMVSNSFDRPAVSLHVYTPPVGDAVAQKARIALAG